MEPVGRLSPVLIEWVGRKESFRGGKFSYGLFMEGENEQKAGEASGQSGSS